MFTLLLLGPSVAGGKPGAPLPAPLAFFGGDAEPAGGTAPALVVEAYYHALRTDEYVVVANPADAPLDVSGWTLTDGEGTLTFPAKSGIAAKGRAVVAQNSTAYWEDTLQVADYRYAAGDAVPMAVSGRFQLSDVGDEVILRDASGSTVDVLAYGASPYAGPGWEGPTTVAVGEGFVAHRADDGAWRDTNTSGDWDLVRVWSLGQSAFPSADFAFTGTVRAFVTPDAQSGPLLDLLSRATTTIDVSLYTLTLAAVLDPLARAAANGTRVRILLEGAPVGGIDEDEWSLLGALAASADIRFLVDDTTLDIQERYRYGHAKYAVLDGQTVVMSTENWGGSSFPSAPVSGSRGWVVAVENASLAAYFTRVFEEDFDARRRDVRTLPEMAVVPVAPTPEASWPREPGFPATAITGSFRVLPVLAPDTALAEETILGILGSATSSVHAELFYAHREWPPFPDLYLEALLAAARRGASVRLLLDASPYNTDDEKQIDNDDTVAYVNGIAANESLDLQARLVDLRAHGFSRMHTKGFVVDGRWTLVSSINWNRNSPTANREAGLLIENPDLAGYFESVFAWDWTDDLAPPIADAGPDRSVWAGESVAFSGLGSSDDAGVVNWSWDLDGDGRDDAWGPEVTRVYRQTGAVTVRLRVADAWGRSAEDSAVVTVQPSPAVTHMDAGMVAILAVPAVLALFALVRFRRQRINNPPRM